MNYLLSNKDHPPPNVRTQKQDSPQPPPLLSRESPLLDEHEAANYLRLSLGTMRRNRYLKRPPAYCKLGDSVRYRREDLEQLIAENMQEPRK
jgi:hypothetical protein